jgi:DNA-binding response OmpR family regulator
MRTAMPTTTKATIRASVFKTWSDRKMRLLVVEDDTLLGSALRKELTRVGYAVDWIAKGADVDVSMRTHEYAGVLLDLGLPDVGGEALLKTIRARNPGVSVLVMTARGGIQDRVALLDIGADDYMVKPIDLDELGARLRAVLRRAQASQDGMTETEHGALKLYPSRRMATWKGEPVLLTNKEYWVLETLVRKKHQVLTRAQLEDALYGWGEEIASNAVEVYIHYLRRKFGSELILTVRGAGYQLGPEEF